MGLLPMTFFFQPLPVLFLLHIGADMLFAWTLLAAYTWLMNNLVLGESYHLARPPYLLCYVHVAITFCRTPLFHPW